MARRLLLLTSAALALALPAATASAQTSCPGADTTISALSLDSARASVLCIVSAERTARGLNALTRNDELELSAQRHSQDMLDRSFFDHLNLDGLDPGERITAAGYEWSSYGENIAAGYSTPRKVMLGWMQSEGHCHNVLNPSFTELGVGVTAHAATIRRGLGTWTQNFGRPQGTRSPGRDQGPQRACPYAALEGLDEELVSEGLGDDTTSQTAAPGEQEGRDREPEVPVGQTPAEDAIPFSATPGLTLALQRSGRRLVAAGTAVGKRVRVTLVRRGRVIYRGRARVRDGRFAMRLRGVPRTGRIVVRVRGGGQRVTRSVR